MWQSHRRNIAKARWFAALLFSAVFIIGLSLPVSAGQFCLGGKKDKDKKDEKKDEKKATAAEDALTVSMLKEYGKKKYQEDPEFKVEVDKSYDKLRRDHQRQAFRVNVQPPLRVMGDLEGEGGNWAAHSNGAMAADDSGPKDALYENPMLQDYINRVGQSLVPANSTK